MARKPVDTRTSSHETYSQDILNKHFNEVISGPVSISQVTRVGRKLAEVDALGIAAQLPVTAIDTAKAVVLGQIVASTAYENHR